MQVHQASQFVLGMIVGGGGLFIFLGCLYECSKSRTLPPHARGPLVSAIVFIALGAGHVSRSYDWPHQESSRTNLIEWSSLPFVLAGVVFLALLRRAEKKAKAEVGTTIPGEHTT